MFKNQDNINKGLAHLGAENCSQVKKKTQLFKKLAEKLLKETGKL